MTTSHGPSWSDVLESGDNVKLVRSLGFWALTAYGVGDILGAGIYALVGKVAGLAGSGSWISFLVAMGVATLTGLTYAELGGRFPRSGGESYFCQQAFPWPWIAVLIGWLVFCSGTVSLATVARAFGGYAQALLPQLADWAVVPGFLVILAVICFWGIRLSSTTNIICTIVEASGLLLVIVVGLAFWGRNVGATIEASPSEPTPWYLIAEGAALAFFAFIGFEDMVNVSEEVKSPQRNVPAAILTATFLAGAIYVLVVFVATLVVPADELSSSGAPLVHVVRRAAPWIPSWSFTMIALFAVANTGLLNIVMASRLVYGMAQQQLLPNWLASVHRKRRTPHWAILVILLVAVILALSGTLARLAGTTSTLLLVVFFTVNVSSIVLKRRDRQPVEGFRVPVAVPIIGAAASLALMAFVEPAAMFSAGVLVFIGLGLGAARYAGIWRRK